MKESEKQKNHDVTSSGARAVEEEGGQEAARHLSASQIKFHALRLRASQSSSGLAGAEAVDVAKQGLSETTSAVPHGDEMRMRGFSLEGVRAHAGPAASQASAALGAEAYTYGNDIAFRSPTPSPAAVAHELRHVEQQSQGRVGSVAADESDARQAETRPAAKSIRPAHHSTTSAPALRLKGALPGDIDKSALAGSSDDKPLSAERVTSAIKYNTGKWKGSQRAEILSYLRGSKASEVEAFTEADVQKAARTQKSAGCTDKDIDGKIGDTSMAIFLHAGLQITAPASVKASQVQLLFYPGEFEDIDKWKAAKDKAFKDKGANAGYNEFRGTSGLAPEGVGKIYVKVSGNLIAKMDCRGGPPIKLKDGSHSADPSRAGTYKLGKGGPYRTNSWLFSQIRWGAQIREHGGEIQFEDPGSSKWKYATGPNCELADEMPRTAFYEGGSLVSEWKKNDFGAVAWRVEGSPGLFVHTTPTSEQTTELGNDPILAHSHGCLHVKPAERDQLMKAGYLQQGVKLTIKHYTSHLLPEEMRNKMLAGGTP